MKPPEKKWPHANAAGQQPQRPTTHARPLKPPVAQTKSAAPASARPHPAAPPAYRPQAKPPVAQRKTAQPPTAKTPHAAPPAYRPQPTPKVLQTKSATHNPHAVRPQALTHARPPHPGEPKETAAAPAINVQQVAQAKRPATGTPAPSDFAPRPVGPRQSNVILRSKAGHWSVIQRAAEAVCPVCGGGHSYKKCKFTQGTDDEPPDDEKKVKKPAKAAEPPKKKEEKFHDLGVSKIEVKAAPAAGNAIGALANISKFNHPDVYLQTLLNISNAGGGVALTVGAGKTLKYNKGTSKETKEHKVTLTGPGTANQFVVIHYHPNAVLPKGALSGHSLVHVKGASAAAYKGKYISPATLGELKLPVPAGHT